MSGYIATGVEPKVFWVLRLKVINASIATSSCLGYPTGSRTLTVQRKRSLSEGQSSNLCL